MKRELEHRVALLAGRQHGVVTRRQLLETGLSWSAVDRRLQSGRMRPLHPGVYLAVPLPLPRTQEMAAVLASGGVLSHLSAAVVWEIRPAPEIAAERVMEITVVGDRGRCRGIRVHRATRLGDDERTETDGIPITTPGRTLLDLATVLGPRDLEAAVARAEREGLVTAEELAALTARHRGHAGLRALKALLEAPGGAALTRSAAEAKLLSLIRSAALPPPECNVALGRYELDFLWRGAGIAVEVDGFRYHSSRPRFEADRRRDAQLLAAGITVVRLSWRQITEDPIATAVQLGQALARADRHRT